MGNQDWLDKVQEQLARHDLAPSYVQRLLEELGDHLEDLQDEAVDAHPASRLGEPEQVATAAVTAYRRRTFLGRHPVAAFLVFAVSPVIAMSSLLLMSLMTVQLQFNFSGRHSVNLHEDHWIASLSLIVCSAFLGFLYSDFARWLGIRKRWMLASYAVLGAIAMFWELALGSRTASIMLLVQFAVPLGMGWWLIKRKCNHRYAVTKCLVFAISPIASFPFLWFVFLFPISMVMPLMMPALVLMGLGVVASIAMLYTLFLLMLAIPTAIASLLYGKLTKGFGMDRKWMLTSCTILASLAATINFQFARSLSTPFTLDMGLPSSLLLAMAVGAALLQFLIPFAIGWRFLWPKHDQRQLQSAP